MTQPKFIVGEVVILQSNKSPHLNGEYTVLAIVYTGRAYQGYDCRFDSPYAYDVGLRDPCGKPQLAAERVLREPVYFQVWRPLDSTAREVRYDQSKRA